MPQPGLEPGPSDPESSTLTTGLLTPHKGLEINPFALNIFISNSPYCLPYNSYDVNFEKLVLGISLFSSVVYLILY